MPTIEFNKNDFFDLLGEQLNDEELDEKLARIKVEVEDIEDDRIEVEITSDRIDLLSVEGVARSLRKYIGQDAGLANYNAEESNYRMDVEDVDARPYVVGAVVKDVDLGTAAVKSLIQLQEKLHGTFGRDRERVSIGIHDMNRISFPLTYMAADPNEYRFLPLQDDQARTLAEILQHHDKGQKYAHLVEGFKKWPLIVDANDKALSFPPIINAQRTEVNRTSTDLFIDVTGTDLESLNYALNVICGALAERGGNIYTVELDTPDGRLKTPDFSSNERSLDFDYLQQIIGIDIDPEKVQTYLERMGYGVIEFNGSLDVLIPSYRPDILHDADIAEDIAIGYGYNNIKPELPGIATIGEEDNLESFMHSVRELAVGLGYQEVMNPTLSDESILVDKPNRKSDNIIELENPVSERYGLGRDMLLPQLLGTLSRNTHTTYPQKIFEAADVILQDDEQPVKTRTDKHLAAVIADREATYNHAREELGGILEGLETDARFTKEEHPSFIPGRCAAIKIQGEQVGVVGEIHPQVLNNHGLEMPCAAFELNLSKLHEL
jgi:phenylalanyl-tRNA synthetase beta chain